MKTSAAICAGGLALMVLPTLVVGNELLDLTGVAAQSACGFWGIGMGGCGDSWTRTRMGVDDRVEGV